MCLPETDAYNKRHNSRNEKGTTRGAVAEIKLAMRMYWQRLIYLVLFMAGFNYMVNFLIQKNDFGKLTNHSLMARRISWL